jgi:hypothetical protein
VDAPAQSTPPPEPEPTAEPPPAPEPTPAPEPAPELAEPPAVPSRPPRVLELAPPALGVSPGLAAALGWLVPGLGQIAVGRVGAGLVLLVTIGGLFAGGLALTDFTAVKPRENPLEFAAQALIGGPTALALGLTEGATLDRMPPWLDVGRLFVVISGLLNLIALCDALGEAARVNAKAREEHARRRAEFFPEAPPLPPSPLPAPPEIAAPVPEVPSLGGPLDVP